MTPAEHAERVRAGLNSPDCHCKDHGPILDSLAALVALAGEADQLRSALTFYADMNNWTQPTSWGGRVFDDEGDACRDCGDGARAALLRDSAPAEATPILAPPASSDKEKKP